jgi:hypothetical protein
MEAKHTPEPWLQDEAGIVAEGWGVVASLGCPEEFWHLGEEDMPAAVSDQIAANALLIASAPELLERLQAIIDWADLALRNPAEFDSHGVRNLDGPVFDEARAILSKATGAA